MKRSLPTLETVRLHLRPFCEQDADTVRLLAGDRAIADTTLRIPHPYPEDAAAAWISTHAVTFAAGRAMTLALVRREQRDLVGAIGLDINPEQQRAELGYWVGRPFWNQGYATEAARAVIAYGFTHLGLHRIYADYLTRNPASGRVMGKLGMRMEGVMRDHVVKWGRCEDVARCAILSTDPRPS